MDANTVKEIANQLGVGTDYLLAHMSELASEWAAFKTARGVAECLLLAATLILCLVAAVLAFRKAFGADRDSPLGSETYISIAIFAAIASVLLFLLIQPLIVSLAGYIASPDAALLNDILKAAKG